MGIAASPVSAGGANVTGHIITSDDGFWFVQYGNATGDYSNTVVGGRLAAKPGVQDISTAAPIADLVAGKYFRVGFTTSRGGLTAYSKESQVLQLVLPFAELRQQGVIRLIPEPPGPAIRLRWPVRGTPSAPRWQRRLARKQEQHLSSTGL